MNIKIYVLTGLFIFLFIPALQAQTEEAFLGLGAGGYNSWESMKLGEWEYFSSGFQFRMKFNPFLGISGDFIYQGEMYYYQDNQDYYWVGPVKWEQVQHSGTEKEDWPFYHTELATMFNLVFYLPLDFIQPYLSIGPAFYLYLIENEDDNEAFQDYFDTTWEGYDSTLGYSIKAGLDIFILDYLSIGLAVDFIVDNMEVFINQAKDKFSDPEYINNNSFIEMNILYWF